MSEREFAAFFSSAKMAGVAPRQYALARSAGYCIPLAWRRHRAKACQTMADPLNCFPCHPAHYSKLHDVLSRLGYAEVPEHLAEQLPPPVSDGAGTPQVPSRPRRRGLLLQDISRWGTKRVPVPAMWMGLLTFLLLGMRHIAGAGQRINGLLTHFPASAATTFC